MKVSLIAAPFVEVPPLRYGGTERILESLGQHLTQLGVDLTLYASGDSSTSIPLEAICDTALFNDPTYDHSSDRLTRMREVNEKTLDLLDRDSDIINCHDYDNLDLAIRLARTGLPIIVSIRHAMTPLIRQVYEEFRGHPNFSFHGLTKRQVQSIDPNLLHIHNGIYPQLYEAVESLDQRRDYFFSIGDMKPIKGHKTAIALARSLGLDLVIAGAPYYPEAKPYFEQHVRPQIDENVSRRREEFLQQLASGEYQFGQGRVIYFGSANDAEKRVLYRHARFMQFLGNLEVAGNIEAFANTIPEALMSGTPVLGVRGSVTEELIKEGKTGINVGSLSEAAQRVGEMSDLQPKQVRAIGIQSYSPEVMARKYLALYHQVLRREKSAVA